jgi:hypothetical protein
VHIIRATLLQVAIRSGAHEAMQDWPNVSEMPSEQLSRRPAPRYRWGATFDAAEARKCLSFWRAECARMQATHMIATEKMLTDTRAALERGRAALARGVRVRMPEWPSEPADRLLDTTDSGSCQ